MTFFYSPLFKYILFPVACLLGTLLLKGNMRGQNTPPFKRDDLVIGAELIWLSLTIYVAGAADKAAQYRDMQILISRIESSQKGVNSQFLAKAVGLSGRADALVSYLTVSGYVIFSLFFMAVGASLFIRVFGWEAPDNPRLWRGISIPVIVGLASLGFVMRLLSVPAI